jgi:hypothetical protein
MTEGDKEYLAADERELQTRSAARAVKREALETADKTPAFRSIHEGFAIIAEEITELWDEVRTKNPDPAKLRKEAIQASAMCLRFAGECAPIGIPSE